MRAGKLRHRVEIRKPTASQDSYGESDITWSVESRRWAAIEPLSGRELYVAQQVNPQVTHRIRMRYFSGLTSDRRIRYVAKTGATARIFNISPPLTVDERNREYRLDCIEAV